MTPKQANALLSAAERVCLFFDWDMTYRDSPDFDPYSADGIKKALVDAVTDARETKEKR